MLLIPFSVLAQERMDLETDSIQAHIEEIIDFKEEMPRFFNPICEQLTDEKTRKRCADSTMLDFVYSRLESSPISHNSNNCLVVVHFTIDKIGKVKNPKLWKDCPPLGENALKVIGQMPAWIPGTQIGKPVEVQYNLPIRLRND